jgi:hypothetical protein
MVMAFPMKPFVRVSISRPQKGKYDAKPIIEKNEINNGF